MIRISMLTFDVLMRFKREYITENYSEEQERRIESDAAIAMYNRHYHRKHKEEWTDEDIYNDFLRILRIDKIPLTRRSD